MIEIDGPPMASFNDRDGNRYWYDVYGIECTTPKECLDAYFNWYREQEGAYIVWRMRPKLELQQEEFPDATWGIYEYRPERYRIAWRCYVMRSASLDNQAILKPEGEAFPII